MYQHSNMPPIHGVIFPRELPLRTLCALSALAFPPESHKEIIKSMNGYMLTWN